MLYLFSGYHQAGAAKHVNLPGPDGPDGPDGPSISVKQRCNIIDSKVLLGFQVNGTSFFSCSFCLFLILLYASKNSTFSIFCSSTVGTVCIISKFDVFPKSKHIVIINKTDINNKIPIII